MKSDKKGLSPVIATVLLIMLAIILAVIILIWVKSFIGEQVTKNLGGGDEPIDTFCKDISFVIDSRYDSEGKKLYITAQNNGNVPIYGFEIRKKSTFSVKTLEEVFFDAETLLSGDTKDTFVETNEVSSGNEILVIPKLVGQAESGKKYYTCDDEFGEEVIVQ